jgi:DNA-binding response OmpR family regulator
MAGERILVVDDDPDLRSLVSRCLKFEGMETVQARDGREALALIAGGPYDLIILDIMMEGTDGYGVIGRLRQEGNGVPVIILSSRREDHDKVLGFSLGADDYVAKPFSPAELVARVKAVLRRSAASAAARDSALRIGPFVLDARSGTFSKGDAPIDLTAAEFKLARFFFEHPGQVFSREQLYLQINDKVEFFEDTVIQVHVSRLREKIEDDPKNPRWIQTVRGLGYRFSETGEGSDP